MMYPRLKLARNLLTDDGVVFISIDDNELHNLRKICDEVFGEGNYRNTLIIKRGAKSVQAQFDIWDKLGSGYEYILFYSKNPTYRFPKMEVSLEKAKSGSWNNHWRGTDRPTMRYEIFGITPNTGQWRWSKERSLKAIQNYKKLLEELGLNEENINQDDIDNWYINKAKGYEDRIDLLRLSRNGKPEHYIPPTDTQLMNDVWFDVPPNSSVVLKNLFKKNIFESPKPIQMIIRMLEFGTNSDIILDFFAGSSTTAHAVMQLNAEDGGNRKFIMVQLPEPTDEKSEAYKAGYKNIAEIGKERIRRAGEKILEENKDKEGVENLDIGFKVFKLDKSNIKEWNPDYDNLQATLEDMVDNFVPGRTEEDVLYEIILKYGIDLTLPIEEHLIEGKKVFNVGMGALFVCLDNNITLDVVEGIGKLKEKLEPEITRVVFKDNGFKDDSVKTNAILILQRYEINEKEIKSI